MARRCFCLAVGTVPFLGKAEQGRYDQEINPLEARRKICFQPNTGWRASAVNIAFLVNY